MYIKNVYKSILLGVPLYYANIRGLLVYIYYLHHLIDHRIILYYICMKDKTQGFIYLYEIT